MLIGVVQVLGNHRGLVLDQRGSIAYQAHTMALGKLRQLGPSVSKGSTIPYGQPGFLDFPTGGPALQPVHQPGEKRFEPRNCGPLSTAFGEGRSSSSTELGSMISNVRGSPTASMMRWTFVVRPPRDRPIPCASAPLFQRNPRPCATAGPTILSSSARPRFGQRLGSRHPFLIFRALPEETSGKGH